MPEQALANTMEGLAGSTMTEKTSESSIMPLLMCCQVAPPSEVFQARCQVPAYSVSGFFGSTAMDSIFLVLRRLAEEMRLQVFTSSVVRYTQSSAPAIRTLELDGAMAMA